MTTSSAGAGIPFELRARGVDYRKRWRDAIARDHYAPVFMNSPNFRNVRFRLYVAEAEHFICRENNGFPFAT
ncbi:hypothetical protein [Candidatus Binatus sp.]|uniref:hypothetical protein n=1 Tax=Candidatus Binatus sp. TaxID=2811406 RepID=UPI003C76AD87